ncbi:hypothetical protein E4U43_002134 [Claviceps pusilla]|uniref:LisH domain-containing protein n=1 Tax=Claviceps pusilla TaxID=123648 RepID=A0A9P7N793_9HYPO|nr:hypothetical protein E4U43_002134 [Claviceps pusilla]
MAMNPNMGMANMNAMGGPVSGAPMPMMNNGAMNPQMAAAAAAARQLDGHHRTLNTYIYEYFIRYGMYDCARSLLSSDQQVNVYKDGTKGGNAANGDDPMDTDSKDDLDAKLPDDLPPPKLPIPASDTSFLYEWFCLFWEIYDAQRVKTGSGPVNQYVAHTQQQTRLKQNQQQELLRQMRPDLAAQQQQYQAQMMRMQQNGGMNMNMKQGNLARAAMANNQNNPQMMLQQAKQNQMQRDPSGMDQSRDRPSSPASGDNAPSPSKRPRIDGAPFNPSQPGGMVTNGRPGPGMPGQQMQPNPSMTAATAAHQLLNNHGIDPSRLNPQQLQHFINAPPAAQAKSIATYSQHLQQHHGTQMGNKQVPNVGGQQNQGSPMMAQGPDGTALSAYYNPDGQMAGPGGIRPGHVGAQAPAGSNHALQDYQMQLMLLEQQNKKRLMMARSEQDTITGMPREGGGPGAHGQPGPNGHFPEASPQAMRSGASPNPSEQMKRGTPQMHHSGISSPVPPEGGQSRESPNPAMNFMGSQVDPNMAPHFFKSGVEGTMAAAAAQAQMNGMRPPSSHPSQPFNGQMNPQQMMAARQMQQSHGQPGQQPGGQGAPGQWQQGPNGQVQVPQGMPQNQQLQGTPQQRSMPPPSAPVVAANSVNNRTTASPQQPAAAPPTPSQATKAAPKKKETKAAKEKRAAAAKKASQNASNNAGATPAGDTAGDAETTPAAPATPVNAAFNKNTQNGGAGQSNTSNPVSATTATASAPRTSSVPPQQTHDPNQNGLMDNNFSMMEFPGIELANPLHSGDVLNDFDFDSFLHDGDGTNEPFDFNNTFPGMEGGEIGAD